MNGKKYKKKLLTTYILSKLELFSIGVNVMDMYFSYILYVIWGKANYIY